MFNLNCIEKYIVVQGVVAVGDTVRYSSFKSLIVLTNMLTNGLVTAYK